MSRVEVNVTEGELSGIVEKGVYDDRYIAFRGIPYATPPIGDLRFQVFALFLLVSSNKRVITINFNLNLTFSLDTVCILAQSAFL